MLRSGRFIGRVVFLFLILSLFVDSAALAAAIRVGWQEPPAGPDPDGYFLYHCPEGETAIFTKVKITDPDAKSYIVNDLYVGTTYHFKLQSYINPIKSDNLSVLSELAICEALPWERKADPPVVPVIVGLGLPEFDFSWDVSDFGKVAKTGLEVSLVNESFTNPNGTQWDPEHRCFVRMLGVPAGTSTMNALNFQGPGLYQIRVVALDDHGTIICHFSDNAFLEVIDGIPGPPEMIITGPGRGPGNPPKVRVYQPQLGQTELVHEFLAYGADGYGVNVCTGDIAGDQRMEIITGPGPGEVYGPHVRGFEFEGNPVPGVSFPAYGTNKFGVNVCTGDIDGDGYDEIVTGAGPGAVFGPHVRGWNVDDAPAASIPGISFFAYGTLKWGVNVAAGDIDGDGYDEIITGAGPGAVFGPHVRGWNYDDSGAATPIPGVSFFAYGTPRWGVNVACGDVDGDGIDEIITGPGPGEGFHAHVRGWNHDGTGKTTPVPGLSFFAYGALLYGVNVACGDIDGDSIDEIVTAPGPGAGEGYTAQIRGWNFRGGVLQQSGLNFLAYSEKYKFGARLAVGRGVN